jgi:hypothetical protein
MHARKARDNQKHQQKGKKQERVENNGIKGMQQSTTTKNGKSRINSNKRNMKQQTEGMQRKKQATRSKAKRNSSGKKRET